MPLLAPDEEIYFGTTFAGTDIFFSGNSILYRVRVINYEHEPQRAGGREGEDWKIQQEEDFVKVRWIGAAANVIPEAAEKVKEVFHYMDKTDPVNRSIYSCPAFREIIYRDLYPGIDLVYRFDKAKGLKYHLVVHPGADPSQISFEVISGQSPHLTSEGNLVMPTRFGTISEQAPESFYQPGGGTINCGFVLSGNKCAFRLDNYDTDRTLIIDPWVTVPTTLLADLKGFDIDKDAAGNIYVYGGLANYKLAKYSAAGALIWTFSTNYDATTTFGDLAVDPAGNCYVINGFATTGGVYKTKVDSGGMVLWYTASTGFFEHFHLSFNCTYTQLAIGGRIGLGDIGFVNTSNGTLFGITSVSNSEVRSMCTSPNGNIYSITCLTVSSAAGNFVLGRTSTLAPIFSVNSGYMWSENGVAYTNGNTIFGPGWSGQNGIASDYCYLYTTNGTLVEKRNAATGAVLLTAVIPGGVAENNSGIAVDNCGNVYVGSQAAVYKFNYNLVQTGVAPTGSPVYGLAIGNNGEILAVGNGFVASLALSACGNVGCSTNCNFALAANNLGFTAILENEKVQLRWNNPSYNGAGKFRIFRSIEKENYSQIAEMDFRPHTHEGNYTLTDDAVPRGRIYYKLETYDDNNQLLSEEVSMVFNSPLFEIKASPNPVIPGEAISISWNIAQPCLCNPQLRLYSTAGQILDEAILDSFELSGERNYFPPPLQPGIYLLEVQIGEEKERMLLLVGE